MDSVPVTLVVKASNQQFEDLTVDCEVSWTVKRLKEHLSSACPCKPKAEEQKLIYAGQLLKDNLVLKDILRTYEDVQPQKHIMHLVYTPKTRQTASNSQNTSTKRASAVSVSDGLRQRNVQRVTNSENVSTIPQTATTPTMNCSNSVPIGGSNFPAFNSQNPPHEYLIAQQLALQNWMQQAYVQYMNQYMNLLSIGVRPETIYMQNQSNTPIINGNFGIPQMPYFPPNVPIVNTNMPTLTTGVVSPSAAGAINSQAGGANSQPAAVPPVRQPEQQQNEQAQPRFPNIVQEELPENRDWLDLFYAFSRLLLLLTLVYFYSSPLRCLVVIFIGLAIYLYHIGFFRTTGEANNNNAAEDERAQNAQRQQQEQQPNNNVNDSQRENQQTVVESDEEADASTNEVSEAQNSGTSVIAFIRTFVVSFFVSLLPDTPAL